MPNGYIYQMDPTAVIAGTSALILAMLLAIRWRRSGHLRSTMAPVRIVMATNLVASGRRAL